MISDSEWKVMSVLWSEEEMSYNKLIEVVSSKFSWSKSTVKTLITRLVKKGKIATITTDSKNVYKTLVSSMDEMRLKIHELYLSLYGIGERKQTKYFTFVGENKNDVIEILSKNLDLNYELFCKTFRIPLTYDNPIILHSTHLAFKNAIARLDSPSWVRIGWGWGILHIAPKEMFGDLDFIGAFYHGIYQSILEVFNPHIPYWLMQGISLYWSSWFTRKTAITLLAQIKSDIDQLDDISKISDNYVEFYNQHSQAIAFTIIDYLHHAKGQNYINDMLCGNQIFDNHLLGEWKTYLRETYNL